MDSEGEALLRRGAEVPGRLPHTGLAATVKYPTSCINFERAVIFITVSFTTVSTYTGTFGQHYKHIFNSSASYPTFYAPCCFGYHFKVYCYSADEHLFVHDGIEQLERAAWPGCRSEAFRFIIGAASQQGG